MGKFLVTVIIVALIVGTGYYVMNSLPMKAASTVNEVTAIPTVKP